MADMQELISRGRFILGDSPKRLEVFKLIDGKRTAKEIAIKTGRKHSAVLNDIRKLVDFELIREGANNKATSQKSSNNIIYEKNPILRHIQLTYFKPIADTKKIVKKQKTKLFSKTKYSYTLSIPDEKAILDIFKYGEDQLYEFKLPGTDPNKLSKEIAAFLHTKSGGIIFYGIDDDGVIIGSDKKRQSFDQSQQNSVNNCITPPPVIRIVEKIVLQTSIILIMIPPWDKKTVYQFHDGKYLIRKGTNTLSLKPNELKKLYEGNYVV